MGDCVRQACLYNTDTLCQRLFLVKDGLKTSSFANQNGKQGTKLQYPPTRQENVQVTTQSSSYQANWQFPTETPKIEGREA